MKPEDQGLALADLQTLLDRRMDVQGGYPAQVEVLDKWIVIADVGDEDAPSLTILRFHEIHGLVAPRQTTT